MQKVKIMTLFVKQKYGKNIVTLHRGFKINTTEPDMEKFVRWRNNSLAAIPRNSLKTSKTSSIMKKLFVIIITILSSTVMNAQQVEDQLALKRLVDTFSNLADVKDVDAQVLLFTEDAEVVSKSGDQVFVSKGREEIGKAFSGFLALFDVVYHLNGQQTVDINGDTATGISYCFVTLIGGGKKNQSGVRYHDTYVKQDGRWLIKKRESDFMFTTIEDMPK